MRLGGRQQHIAAYGTRDKRWTLVSGPMGSGKTFAAAIGFTLESQRWAGAEFGILTKSVAQMSSFRRECLERILDRDISLDDEGSFVLPGASGGQNRFRCFVAQDKRAEPRLRSFNLSGALVDEMTLLPTGMLEALNGRVRVGEHAKIIGCTNPDGPRHNVKVNYFDKAEGGSRDEGDGEMEAIYTELADNPVLPASYIESLKRRYRGHWRDRMVYGHWVAARGMVYPRAIEFSDRAPTEEMVAYDVVIDVGESSVTCALLSGRTASGKTWILDEWYYDHSEHGHRTVRSMVGEIRMAFIGYDITSWIVDPAAKTFRLELIRQMGSQTVVGKAENDWIEGVEEVNLWFERDGLHIWGEHCPKLLDTIGKLVYDVEKSEMGEDVPVKVPDHLTDCLRYLVLTRAIHEAGGRQVWEARRKQSRET